MHEFGETEIRPNGLTVESKQAASTCTALAHRCTGLAAFARARGGEVYPADRMSGIFPVQFFSQDRNLR